MSGRSHMTAMNGKRPSAIPARLQPEPSAQHDDLIKFICESWNLVSRELDMCHQQHNNSANYRNGASVTYYQEREPNPQLKAISLTVHHTINVGSCIVGCMVGLLVYTFTILQSSPFSTGEDFEPFNLEAWWGQRVVQSITRNATS